MPPSTSEASFEGGAFRFLDRSHNRRGSRDFVHSSIVPLHKLRGPQMGGGGVRSVVVEFGVFWGTPIFRPEVPKPLGTSGLTIGAPQNAKPYHDGSDATFAALCTN